MDSGYCDVLVFFIVLRQQVLCGCLLYYYQLYQLGTGGHKQKVKPVQGVYQATKKPRECHSNTHCIVICDCSQISKVKQPSQRSGSVDKSPISQESTH